MTINHSIKIGAIVPAYNEGPRIAKVLDVLTKVPFLQKIVVVDDGSRDQTFSAASDYDVELLKHRKNLGKGAALQTGLQELKEMDVVLFLDADLVGLTQKHIEILSAPLLEKPESAMVIGRFLKGRPVVDMQQKYFAILNGQRALSRSFIERLPDFSWTRFGVEVFLNRFAASISAPMEEVLLYNITHVIKEEKFGFRVGFATRLKMYHEALAAHFKFSHMVSPGKLMPWSAENIQLPLAEEN